MQSSEPPAYEAMFGVLNDYGVKFVVIGGIGALLQGVPQMSFDLDIVPEPSDENVSALSQALVAMSAEVLFAGKVRHWVNGEWLRASRIWNFTTIHGRFDVLFEPTGVDGFQGLLERSTPTRIEGETRLSVAAVSDLIAMKESANRAKDQPVLEYLRYLRDRAESPQIHPPDSLGNPPTDA